MWELASRTKKDSQQESMHVSSGISLLKQSVLISAGSNLPNLIATKTPFRKNIKLSLSEDFTRVIKFGHEF